MGQWFTLIAQQWRLNRKVSTNKADIESLASPVPRNQGLLRKTSQEHCPDQPDPCGRQGSCLELPRSCQGSPTRSPALTRSLPLCCGSGLGRPPCLPPVAPLLPSLPPAHPQALFCSFPPPLLCTGPSQAQNAIPRTSPTDKSLLVPTDPTQIPFPFGCCSGPLTPSRQGRIALPCTSSTYLHFHQCACHGMTGKAGPCDIRKNRAWCSSHPARPTALHDLTQRTCSMGKGTSHLISPSQQELH